MATKKVKAVFPDGGFGFDGIKRRRHDEEFTVDETLIQPWMEEVKDEPKPKAEKVAKAPAKPEAKAAKTKAKKSAKAKSK